MEIAGHRDLRHVPCTGDLFLGRGLFGPSVGSHECQERHDAAVVSEAEVGRRAVGDVFFRIRQHFVENMGGKGPSAVGRFGGGTFFHVESVGVARREGAQFVEGEQPQPVGVDPASPEMDGEVKDASLEGDGVAEPCGVVRVGKDPCGERLRVDLLPAESFEIGPPFRIRALYPQVVFRRDAGTG